MRFNTYIKDEMVRTLGNVDGENIPEYMAILLQNLLFIDLTDFGFIPAIGSKYINNVFELRESNLSESLDENFCYFAGIVNEEVVRIYKITKEDPGAIAIAQSSPTFKLEDDSIRMYNL